MKNFFVRIQDFSFHIPSQFISCLKQKLTIHDIAETKTSEQMKELFIIYIAESAGLSSSRALPLCANKV